MAFGMTHHTAQHIVLESADDVCYSTASAIYYAMYIDMWVAVSELLLYSTASALRYYIAKITAHSIYIGTSCAMSGAVLVDIAKDIACNIAEHTALALLLAVSEHMTLRTA